MSRESQLIDAQGVRLHVTLRGDGPPLLLLHGFTGGGHSLGRVTDRFARSRRTIAPDLVGHGASDVPEDVAAYAMEACVAQLVGVLDALSVPRVDVFGYSLGGRPALALCAAPPERLGRAVLVGASAGLATEKARRERVEQDTALATLIEQQGVVAFAKEWAQIPLFATQAQRLSLREREAAQRMREANSARGLANSLRGMGTGAQPPLHGVLPRIETPVLCLAGSDDEKFRCIAQTLAEALPHGEAHVIPEAGHAAHLENPETTAEVTLAFLDRTQTTAEAQRGLRGSA